MTVNIQTTQTFQNLLESNHRISQHIGGTRSGKTYAILQYLIVKALENSQTITIVRRTIPSLKRTLIKDFKDIMQSIGIWKEDEFNISDRTYQFNTNSTIQFINTDDADKLRGLKSDILFIDEASEIDEESYFQLKIRTTGQIILAFNPTISPFHWLRQMNDCDRFTTTYRDNPFLPAEMIKSIEDLAITSPKKFLIYGKGEYAPNDRAIYQFDVVEDVKDAEFVGFGLDWGFSQDPTAMVAIYKNGNHLYVEELIYDRGLVMNDIINRLKSLGIEREEIWCDSSEPMRIEELARAGFNAKKVVKGPNSISFGIGVVQNYQLHIYKQSQNLINEIYGYQYATDKFGYVTTTPEGIDDHLLDAMRYVAMMKLSVKSQNKGNYAISIR
jgi:phage terminase large subunit